MLGGNILGGPFYMYHPISGTYYVVAFNGEFGNPGIDFDSSINANPNVLINLSSSNAIPIDEKYFENESVTVQELILTQDLSDTICDSLGVSGNPINPVFAMYDGIYWIHDPRFVSHRVLCGAIKLVLTHCTHPCVPLVSHRKQSPTRSSHRLPMEVERLPEKQSTFFSLISRGCAPTLLELS